MKNISAEAVSILMAVKNSEDTIIESIESVLSQTYKNFMLYVVDDNSIDKTYDVVSTINDPRLILLRNTRSPGQAGALNTGLNMINTDLIFRIDADDYFMAEKLTKQIEFIKRDNKYIIVGTQRIIKKNNEFKKINSYYGTVERKDLIYGNFFVHSTVMLNCSLADKNNFYYNENLDTCQDYELWVRLLREHPGYILKDALIIYTETGSQVSKKKRFEQERESMNIQKNLFYEYEKGYYKLVVFMIKLEIKFIIALFVSYLKRFFCHSI